MTLEDPRRHRPHLNTIADLNELLHKADKEWLYQHRLQIFECAKNGSERKGRGAVIVSPSFLLNETSVEFVGLKQALDSYGYISSVIKIATIDDRNRRLIRRLEEELDKFRDRVELHNPRTEFVLYVNTNLEDIWSTLASYPGGMVPNIPPELL